MKRAIRLVGTLVCASVLTGCSTISGDKPVRRKVDDAGITAAVKTKLVADEPRMLSDVDVETVNRIVYLTGTVPDELAERRATEIARSIEGVNKVVNDLDTE